MLCHHISVLPDEDRATDPISVTFFDQVALFFDFNRLFELLGPGHAPYSSNAFYIIESSSKKHFKIAHVNFTNNFQVGNACFPQRLLNNWPGW